MTALADSHTTTTRRSAGPTGKRTELARYTVTAGERILYGQRVDGSVRITDHPVDGHGRAVLVEGELELDGNAALAALVNDYCQQATVHDHVPMLAVRSAATWQNLR
jgi:hypothetical protein